VKEAPGILVMKMDVILHKNPVLIIGDIPLDQERKDYITGFGDGRYKPDDDLLNGHLQTKENEK
jgi:hypothetical protein